MTDAKKGENILIKLTYDDWVVITQVIDSYITSHEELVINLEKHNKTNNPSRINSIEVTRALFNNVTGMLKDIQIKILDGIRDNLEASPAARPSVLDKFWTRIVK